MGDYKQIVSSGVPNHLLQVSKQGKLTIITYKSS